MAESYFKDPLLQEWAKVIDEYTEHRAARWRRDVNPLDVLRALEPLEPASDRLSALILAELNRAATCRCWTKRPCVGSHGMSDTPTYNSWTSMRRRALGKYSHKSCLPYVGIDVEPAWMASFEAFFADMGERPPGTSLDRIDGTKGYVRGNCRWADAKTQGGNRKTTTWVEFNGKRMMLTEAARVSGIKHKCLSWRYRRGLRGDRLFAPVRDCGTKLTEADVVELRQLRREGTSHADLAERFGVSTTTVAAIIHRRLWKNVADRPTQILEAFDGE